MQEGAIAGFGAGQSLAVGVEALERVEAGSPAMVTIQVQADEA